MQHIRNFSIIAHVDHGKSTLADRIIQLCGGLQAREMEAQVLDSNPIERERGITIKAQSVSLPYTARDGQVYQLNFIDTPGHVDFSYEVSRSLAACEGALLVVDAAQGVEAQSVANCYTAVEQGLEVVPVLNKIDLPTADIERAKREIEAVIGIDADDAVAVSAKTGLNVDLVLEAIVQRIPPPQPRDTDKLQALIIDSWFDNYLGVVSLVRVMQGEIGPKSKILVMSTGRTHEVDKVGVFTPKRKELKKLGAGEVGWITASIKDVHGAPVGDTLTLANDPAPGPLPGFQEMQPRVFAGLFPVDAEDYPSLREALEKLRLNDAALRFEPESSEAMGFGFRCGFLGMLHMEIVQERLEREYDLNLISTAPTVIYEVLATDGSILPLDNPSKLPPVNKIDEIRAVTTKPIWVTEAGVSSFGADSVVLLHMVAQVDKSLPVYFLETGKHFPETLAYVETLKDRLGLSNLRVLHPDARDLARFDPDGTLWETDPDSCCHIRKTEPLDAVVNLAGAPIADRPWTKSRKALLWDSRVKLTEQLVEWLGRREQKPALLISGSAVGWYGDGGERDLPDGENRGDGAEQGRCHDMEQGRLAAAEHRQRNAAQSDQQGHGGPNAAIVECLGGRSGAVAGPLAEHSRRVGTQLERGRNRARTRQ